MVYGSQNVKCPFYKDETKNSIRCEGAFSATVTNNFANTKDKYAYMKAFCYGIKSCEKCTLYESVMDKYNTNL